MKKHIKQMQVSLVIVCCLTLLESCAYKVSNKALEVKAIDQNVYMHTSFKKVDGFGWVDSNGLVVINNNQAIIVDTPWSEKDTEELLSWISTHGFTIKASVSTHYHDDRTAGIRLLNSKSIPTYTSELTNDILIRKNLPVSSQVFSGDRFLMLNDLIEIYYPGEGHTKDNLVVWLPENKLLFGGCLIRPVEWKSLGYIGDANISQWSESVKNVQNKYPVINKVVPGHGNIGNESLLSHTIDLVEKR